MSTFGGNSNFTSSNADSFRNNQKSNGYDDPRRSGNIGTRKKNYSKTNGLYNNTSNSNNFNGNNRRNDKNFNNPDRKKNISYHPKKGHKQAESSSKTSSPGIAAEGSDISMKVIPRQNPEKMQRYSRDEIDLTGPLYPDPEFLGFQRNNKIVKLRSVPKYLLNQPRLLETSSFHQNEWDRQNQEKMLSMEKTNNGNDVQGLYEEFQRMREIERKKMEELGLVDAENTRKDLNEAISFQGTCLDMCPIFERVRRALENNVKALEKDPVTNKISRQMAVKAFSRPAAGQPPPLPSDVRPPHILKQALDYLVDNIVTKLPEGHSFLWDRTRSIRQDFTYQNFFGPEAIDCNERIVRIHLISLHIMAGSDVEYSQQQELEQFNKALQTLIEIYQDVRNNGGKAPNEAEFRAYHLLSHLRDPELEREIQCLPDDILQDKQVQLALMFRNIISQNNIVERGFNNSVGALNLFVEFFKIVYSDKTPFLMACLLETHFNEIRFYALKSMSRCYHTKGKAYPAEYLKNMLGFDSLEKLIKFITYYEIDLVYENGETLVDLFNKEKLETKYKLHSVHDKPKLAQAFSTQLNIKIEDKSLRNFINCGKQNYNLGLRSSNEKKIIQSDALNKPIFNIPSNGLASANISPVSNGFSSNNLPASNIVSNGFISGGNRLAAPSTASITSNLLSASHKPPGQSVAISPFSFQPSIQKQTSQPELVQPTQESLSKVSTSGAGFNLPKPSFIFKADHPKSETIKPPAVPLFDFKPKEATPTSMPSISTSKLPASTFKFDKDFSPKILPVPKFEVTNKANTFVPAKAEQLVSKPSLPAISPSPIMKEEPSKPPIAKKLIDLPQFPKALGQVFDKLLQETISSELSILLPKLIRHEIMTQERNQVIKSLSNELYLAFLSEIIYKVALEVIADHIYNRNLRLKIIKKLIKIGSRLKTKQELKRKKFEELTSISFKLSGTKRRLSSSTFSISPVSSCKKRHIWDHHKSIENINQRQNEVKQLWEPIDLKNFLKNCSKNLKIKIEAKDVEIKFLLVIEDWTSPYSKWLNTKLSLKVNKENLVYENMVKDNKVIMNFTSLPNNNYLNKEFFSNTSFILFECGFHQDDSRFGTIQDKLKRDQGILNKIIELSKKYSYYKIQILIVYWDAKESNLSTEEVSEILNLRQHFSNEVVKDIILCDMTVKTANINDILINGFNTISYNFKGELTLKGIKKKERSNRIREISGNGIEDNSTNLISNDTFKEKESRVLDRAKLTRKYEYLSKHISSANISNVSNISGNSTMFITANKSIKPMSTFNLPSDSTFLNLDTSIGANTTLNNLSILTGFGNGVIEESTPYSSPKSKKFAKPSAKNIPRSLQQLRDLTAGIKAKYKK